MGLARPGALVRGTLGSSDGNPMSPATHGHSLTSHPDPSRTRLSSLS